MNKPLLHEVVVAMLEGQTFGCVNEYDLQDAVAQLLGAAHNVEREARLSSTDRIDFLVKHHEGTVGVEIKVGGSRAEVLRQLARYADYEGISSLILVTNKSRHRAMPKALRGKPLFVVYVGGVS